jgi:uncharacterized RDD family membrane protein YckC
MSEPETTRAGPGRRLAAALYDSLIVIAIWMLAYLPVVAMLGGHLQDSRDPRHLAFRALLAFAFFAWSWTRGGQTLGMQAWRLRLERMDGGTPDLGAAARRFGVALIYLLPFTVFIALGADASAPKSLGYGLLLGPFLLGIIWSRLDAQGLAPHDRLSGTRVIRVLPAPSA